MVACAAPAGLILMGGTNTTVTGVGTADDPLRIHAATVGTGLTPRGPWDHLVAYVEGDIVSYGGGSWVAQIAGINHQPDLTEGVYWTSIARQGATGIISWRGPWSVANAYAANDLVASGGSTWRALVAVAAGGAAPVEGATWTAQALKGDSATGYVARGENTTGISTAAGPGTTAVDIPGCTASWVADGNPYELSIDGHLICNIGTAASPAQVGATILCMDVDLGTEIFRTALRGTVQTGSTTLFAPCSKKTVKTYAAALTKNVKLQIQLGTSGIGNPTGAIASASAGATFPLFVGVKHG